MVFKNEKSVFKNAVAVYFQYTKKKFNNYNARYVRGRIRACAPAGGGRGRKEAAGRLGEIIRRGNRACGGNCFPVQKNCAPNAEGLSPYRHRFIFADYVRANKTNSRPRAAFLFFCMPGR